MATKPPTNPLITAAIVKQALAILDNHFGAAVGVICGEDLTTTEGWQTALNIGLVKKGDKPPIGIMHNFGVFLAHVEHADGSSRGHGNYGTTTEEFLEAIEAQPVPRLESEYNSSLHAAAHAAVHLRGLGNKYGATIGSKLIEADRKLAAFMRQQVNDAAAARYGDAEAAERLRQRAIEQGKDEGFYDGAYRNTIKRFRSDMAHLTDDHCRDWDRIAQTEAQNAVNTGISDGWQQQEAKQAKADERPPKRLLAYKVPRPGACKHCDRLHMRGGSPRVYFLNEIEGNGSNIGRKAAEWRIVVGATHPYCACPLFRLPKVIQPPKGWSSGEPMPDIITPDGRLK